jgi:hypothetical protein
VNLDFKKLLGYLRDELNEYKNYKLIIQESILTKNHKRKKAFPFEESF